MLRLRLGDACFCFSAAQVAFVVTFASPKSRTLA